MTSRRKRKPERLLLILYPLLVISVVLYAVTNNIAIGLLVFFAIIAILYIELRDSIRNEGWKKSLIDVGIALAVVAVFWVVLAVAMQTTAPLDVVTSCSMLPQLQRGDVVLLHGIPNMSSFLRTNNVPIVNVSAAAYSSMLSNMHNEFLAYYPYVNNDPAQILPNGVIPHNVAYSVGLYNTKCIIEYSYADQPYNYGHCMVNNATQQSNLIRYSYTTGNVAVDGSEYGIVYTTAIQIANVSINESYSNPIIIYRTNAEDTFSGDIIHRVVAAIDAGGTYYLLTKGDNNQGLDMQFANYPPSQSSIVGYRVASVPYLGYLKLIISGQIAEPAGCNQTILH